jgi:outer membrane protein assembly factor BamD (BamD/ComL family)
LGAEAFEAGKWQEAARQFHIVVTNFPSSSYGQDALFFLGIAYYHLREFDISNETFDKYLQSQTNPRYFQEAFDYKFCVAEQFRGGARRRFLSTKAMPRWASGRGLGITIYDEVIASLPSDEIAARSLFGKACLLWQQKDYRNAVEAFLAVTKRYSKHELAPESYLLINRVYIDQSQREFQNPDILAFAQINLGKFEEQFPREERLAQARADLLTIKEIYARGMFDMGQFYERIRQPRAAVIYYQKAMIEFPETCIARTCRRKLSRLDPKALEIEIPNKEEEADSEEIEFLGRVEL